MKIIKNLIIYFLIIIILFSLKYPINNFISKSFLISNKKRIMKRILLFKIFKKTRININNISTLFIKGIARFGNLFISLNNAIIYCELISCKKIIVEYSSIIYINQPIFCKKRNFTIEPNQSFNYKGKTNSVILDVYFFFFTGFRYLGNVNRLGIFKKQLLNNLPKVITHPNELYIYIRGGDIFLESYTHNIRGYFQPPLCFYEKILDNFKFNKVFILSQDSLNPVIPKLLNKYSYISKKKNELKVDISYLINSYKMVAGKSTFFSTSIKFNDKLNFLWEYDYSLSSQKYLHLHYSVYKFPFYYTVYKMNSSHNYRKLMYPWLNTPKQRKMMIKEKCKKNFNIIRKNQ